MIGIKIHLDNKEITVYNCYCPPRKEHVLHAMNISEHCIVVGVFNSHSPSWGYPEQDARREEVEDWQTSSNLLLINDARLRRETISTQRKGWQEKTASLNLEKDGGKLWNLMEQLNGEKTKVGPVVLEKEGKTVTGKRAAYLFIKQYADISDIEIDKDRRRQVSLDIQELKELSHGQKDIEMDRQFTHEELEQAIKALKMKKNHQVLTKSQTR